MLNLIRADFYKAIHGKVLKVCFLMMTGWIFLCAYAQKATIGMREYLVGTEVSANYWDSFFNYYPVVFPLKQLSERNRETLLMYYFLEMNNEEIAKKQNISRSGVFQNRHNSLVLMKKLLKEKQ